MMILEINNKIFDGKFNENGILIIPLENDIDKIFFKTWQDKAKEVIKKQDYVNDVVFMKVTEHGVLKNCFPILSMNEDFVELHYDYFILS